MLSRLAAATFLTGAASLAAEAAHASVLSTRLIYASSDCGDIDFEVREFGLGSAPDGQSVDRAALELRFDNFSNFLDRPGYLKKKCLIDFALEVPAGMQFRALSATVAGSHSIARQAEGSVEVSYAVDATNAKGSWSKREMTGENDFIITAQMDNQSFTACSNRPVVVNLSSEILTYLMSNSSPFSEIILDTQDSAFSLKWDWNFKSCNGGGNDGGNGDGPIGRDLSGNWGSGYGSQLTLRHKSGNCASGIDEVYRFNTAYGLGTRRSGEMTLFCRNNSVIVRANDGLVYKGKLGSSLVWFDVPLKVGVRNVTWNQQ